MPNSSTTSDTVYVLKPDDRGLRSAWWCGLHAFAAAGLLLNALPLTVRLALVAGLGVHALARRPARPPLLLVTESGRWSVPAAGLFDRRPAAGSLVAPGWLRLKLAPGVACVLLRADFNDRDWRRIRIALRAAARNGAATSVD